MSSPAPAKPAACQKALVTGASGYIGRILCSHLRQHGWDVVAMLRTPQQGPWNGHVVANLGEAPLPAGALTDIDTVFHLAASADRSDPSEITEVDRKVNIHGTGNLLAAAQQAGVGKFVYISSVKAMGEGGEGCLDETSPPAPVSSYGRSKLAAEQLVLGQSDIPACVLRLPVVYGKSGQGNISRMIHAVLRHRFPPLPEVGNRRSMVHVEDVVRAAELLAVSPGTRGQVYLVTDGEPCTTRQIYECICQASGTAIPAWYLPAWLMRGIALAFDVMGKLAGRSMPLDSFALQKLLGTACYSNEKIRAELGFTPLHTLRESIPEMVAEALADKA